MLVSDTKALRVSLVSLGPQALLAPRVLRFSSPRTMMGLWCLLSLDPEDRPALQELQGPRERLVMTENQEILARMGKLAQKDLQDSPEPPEMPAQEEKRETVERVSLDPEVPQGLQDPQDLDSDRRSWTWRALGSQIWKPSGASLDCLAPPALLVPLAPPTPALH